MLEEAMKAIDENTTLEIEVKEEIKNLIVTFNTFFPNISLENFINRIKTLKFEKTNKFVSKKIFDYIPLTNVLSFNVDKIKKEYDMKHVLMSALLNIITAHNNTYGFDYENRFLTFNIGYTEILSNFLVGNEGDISDYDDEIIATNLIAELVGHDVLFEAYFSNNHMKLANAIHEMEGDINERSNKPA